jgi:hypothetical protein
MRKRPENNTGIGRSKTTAKIGDHTSCAQDLRSSRTRRIAKEKGGWWMDEEGRRKAEVIIQRLHQMYGLNTQPR